MADDHAICPCQQNEDERIDSYLADVLSDISRSKIQNSIKKGESTRKKLRKKT